MKAIRTIIAMIGLLCGSYIIGCPTCMGRLKLKDEPFFSDRFYQSIQQSDSHDALKTIEIDAYDLTDDIDINEGDEE